MKKLFFRRRPKGEKILTPDITTIGVQRFTGTTEEAGRESLARFGPPGSGPDPLPPV